MPDPSPDFPVENKPTLPSSLCPDAAPGGGTPFSGDTPPVEGYLPRLETTSGSDTAFSASRNLADWPRTYVEELPGFDYAPLVNDVTGLNPIPVSKIIHPKTTADIARAVQAHEGPVSIGGGRYSMGGQTAVDHGVQIDMRGFNQILAYEPAAKRITVQAGATWRQILNVIDGDELAVKIMQTYANFTVGGSLSVNCHGRYMGLGPVVLSVDSIRLVLADGTVRSCSPTENSELFYGAIGGYGGIGVIAEATLQLSTHRNLERRQVAMPTDRFEEHFDTAIRNNPDVVMFNADIYPPYKHLRVTTWNRTDRALTVLDRLQPEGKNYWFNRLVISLITEHRWGRLYRRLADAVIAWRNPVVRQNYEASYDVAELEPSSRAEKTYVLQEFFVPPKRLDDFYRLASEIGLRHGIATFNTSVRYSEQDPGTILAWARSGPVFSFVHYYKQGTDPVERGRVGVWTRELIDAVLDCDGTWYPPYQIHATPEQVRRGFPRLDEYIALKCRVDPKNKFRNRMIDFYTTPPSEPGIVDSVFRSVFLNTKLRDDGYRFLQLIYNLFPEAKFHHLVHQVARTHGSDEEIYREIQRRLPEVTPRLQPLRFALPSLRQQKREMTRETMELLGTDARGQIDGYVEIGTTGRYVPGLRRAFGMTGPVYVVNDLPPTNSPTDIMERGGLRRVGTFVENHYEPIPPEAIPDESVDLVTVYIGLHHCPPEKLDAYVASLHRILRPGGRLVVRDHDAKNPEVTMIARFAHLIYNAGLGLPWEQSKREDEGMHLRSRADVSSFLEARGFKDSGKAVLQHKDPTLNTLLEFRKPDDEGAGLRHKFSRPAESTYLTHPEWKIVYDARDYARCAVERSPTDFPWFQAIRDYWREHRWAVRQAKTDVGTAKSAMAMLLVIGPSYTLETLVKGLYEHTIGRLTRRLGKRTAEDEYGAKLATDIATFMDVRPWYMFPFGKALVSLWRDVPILGSNPIRKLERRLWLSSELLAKAVYGQFIKALGGSNYADKRMTHTLILTGPLPEALSRDERFQVQRNRSDRKSLVLVPRYQSFTDVVQAITDQGVELHEVAGQRKLLVSTRVDIDDSKAPFQPTKGALLRTAKALTDSKKERRLFVVPVSELSLFFREAQGARVSVEHVYDC